VIISRRKTQSEEIKIKHVTSSPAFLNLFVSLVRVYLFSGNCDSPLPPNLRPSESSSVAVFTYDILQTSTRENRSRLAVMFSVPNDCNLYSNRYSVGEFSKDKPCNKELYTEMLNGVHLAYNAAYVTFRASMSEGGALLFKVNRIWDIFG
uniref:Uncharacterized protein n=1 Tax=Xiphophorus maculatus TaxID=8083 RepID=A0A3B5QSE2_XIPMA